MTKTLLFAATFLATTASAQINVQMQIGLPQIVFPAPPPLVVIEPGIQVVEDHDDEVFFVDGWYWTRRDARWFRTRQHNSAWVVVEHRHVHPRLVKYKPGHYKRWKRNHGGHDGHGHGHGHGGHGGPPGHGGKHKFKKKD